MHNEHLKRRSGDEQEKMEEKEKKPPHWTLEKIKELKEGYEALAFGFPPEYLQDVKGIIELIQQAKEEEERKKEKEKH